MVYTNERWSVCIGMIYIYNLYGIYMVYTWYFSCICRPDRYVRYIPCQDLLGFSRIFFYNDIPLIYHEYLKDIHSILL